MPTNPADAIAFVRRAAERMYAQFKQHGYQSDADAVRILDNACSAINRQFLTPHAY